MTPSAASSPSLSSSSPLEITYPSSNGVSQIRACIWEPEVGVANSKGVIQLVHGMAEHVMRYDHFARYLASRGYIVAAEDHIGHGKTASSADELGVMDPKSKEVLIEDVHTLRNLMEKRYPQAPTYTIFGHSMGSFITRAYLARHGEGLSGAIICGTGNQPHLLSKAGNLLARFLSAVRGSDYKSTFIDSLGAGSFAKGIEGARTPVDWISTDPLVVDAYLADELSGQMFSVGAYATLTDLTGEVVTKQSVNKIPKRLPVLFIAGAQDPVGECGKAVLAAARLFESCGITNTKVIIYEDMRHEILNEPNAQQVYEDVYEWLQTHE